MKFKSNERQNSAFYRNEKIQVKKRGEKKKFNSTKSLLSIITTF